MRSQRTSFAAITLDGHSPPQSRAQRDFQTEARWDRASAEDTHKRHSRNALRGPLCFTRVDVYGPEMQNVFMVVTVLRAAALRRCGRGLTDQPLRALQHIVVGSPADEAGLRVGGACRHHRYRRPAARAR
jgi:hypothetical protein